ncbi:MAG: redox-sensing transcriptional repressor Rex [Sedimentisphaerales bacterium]|nr:redox-sensing transcriptional repressor Rex [Sedimentisphaerales bacterium]
MRYHRIPDETVRRLPIYLRGLMFSADQGNEHISSRSLAEFVGVHAWLIRKDFSYFGDFGTPGVGYNIQRLARQIKKILRLDSVPRAALVGVGDLGSALLAYPGFATYGLDIVAAFDTSPKKIGKVVNGVKIEPVVDLAALKQRDITLAIVAVPRAAAQPTVDRLVEVGVKGILNFAPCKVQAPKRVKVITLDIAMELARLPYYIPTGQTDKGKGAQQ